MSLGICRLTGDHGKLVKAHLLPKSVTRPERQGAPFIQFREKSGRPVRRWSSWYDGSLVTRKGEDILADLDDWAITQLRKHKLIWSGWGPMLVLNHDGFSGTSWGVRSISGIDPKRLRLFFLSLLWRAAATTLQEFSEVTLPETELNTLGDMLLRGDPTPLDFYPASLTQLSTIGRAHNMPPIASTKIAPAIGDFPRREIPFFRFYFEGLICHIHRQTGDNGETKELGPLIVGGSEMLSVMTVTYEQSFEKMNLEAIVSETEMKWSDVLSKL